ncbi:MAG TPA: nuclear transport factor 2 family protein [Candidatus Dormibacteraeota bacterium]|jgi:hypothetical protein
MVESTALGKAEVKDMVDAWYRALDVHAPVAELLPMLADEGLEMRFPEATLKGQPAFVEWYEGVTRKFFDEIHDMKELNIDPAGDEANVKLVVNWQAKVWNPPDAKSKWLGFDAYQTWIVKRSPQSGRPVIATYIVDELRPMEGSAVL